MIMYGSLASVSTVANSGEAGRHDVVPPDVAPRRPGNIVSGPAAATRQVRDARSHAPSPRRRPPSSGTDLPRRSAASAVISKLASPSRRREPSASGP